MKTLFLFFALSFGLFAQAQSAYKLVYYRGIVQTSSDKKLWVQQTIIGSALNTGTTVKLEDKAEAVFSNEAGEVVYLKKPGNYDVKDFATLKTAAADQSFTTYYFKYVAGQVTHHHEDVEGDYKENLRNLGGVSRGHMQSCLLTPNNAELILDTVITFSWSSFSTVKDYTFIIFSDSLLQNQTVVRDVRDTFTTVSCQSFKAGNTYYWKIESRTLNNCMESSFTIPSAGEKKSLEFQHKELLKGLIYSKGLNKLIEAQFYTSKGAFKPANDCYKQALKLEPDNEAIVQAYQNFMQAQ